jgi:hypothetical protein
MEKVSRLGGRARSSASAHGPASVEKLDVLSLSLQDDDHDDVEAALIGIKLRAAGEDSASDDSEDEASEGALEEAPAGTGAPAPAQVVAEEDEDEEEDQTSSEDGDSQEDDLTSEYLANAPMIERMALGVADAGERAVGASARLLAAGARSAWQGVNSGVTLGAGAAGRGVGAALTARHTWRGFMSGFSQVPQSEGDIELSRVRDPESDGDGPGDAPHSDIPRSWRERLRKCQCTSLAAAGGALLAVAALSSLFGVGITEQHADRSARDAGAQRFKAQRFNALLHPPAHATGPRPTGHAPSLPTTVAPASHPPPPLPPPSPSVIWRQAICATLNVTSPFQLEIPSPPSPPPPPLRMLANVTLGNASRVFWEMNRASVRGGGVRGGGSGTNSGNEGSGSWWRERVASGEFVGCSPGFPQERISYGRSTCAQTEALDISLVFAASNGLTRAGLDILQRHLTALSLFPWAHYGVTSEIVIVSWINDSSKVPLYQQLM